jgi:hypothetical protein
MKMFNANICSAHPNEDVPSSDSPISHSLKATALLTYPGKTGEELGTVQVYMT